MALAAFTGTAEKCGKKQLDRAIRKMLLDFWLPDPSPRQGSCHLPTEEEPGVLAGLAACPAARSGPGRAADPRLPVSRAVGPPGHAVPSVHTPWSAL